MKRVERHSNTGDLEKEKLASWKMWQRGIREKIVGWVESICPYFNLDQIFEMNQSIITNVLKMTCMMWLISCLHCRNIENGKHPNIFNIWWDLITLMLELSQHVRWFQTYLTILCRHSQICNYRKCHGSVFSNNHCIVGGNR